MTIKVLTVLLSVTKVTRYLETPPPLPPFKGYKRPALMMTNQNVFFSSQKFIGQYPEDLFTEDEAKRVISTFQEKLRGISEEIKQRNATLEEPYQYIYLLPEKVPNSIAI